MGEMTFCARCGKRIPSKSAWNHSLMHARRARSGRVVDERRKRRNKD